MWPGAWTLPSHLYTERETFEAAKQEKGVHAFHRMYAEWMNADSKPGREG